MGSVWLAHDTSLDSTCAIKLIDEQKSKNEEIRLRFAREAKATAQLRGPHVVDVFDRGECDGILYIAMEYLEGEDLCSRLAASEILSGPAAYKIVAHVARALAGAHALGIVHRDLKPENIFLIPGYDEEIAKVLDFGIAQHDDYQLVDRATRTGSFLGTPYYVSPEQARGRPTDHRSDLWSLGVITFQCLTGRLPFDADSLADLMCLILSEPIVPITAYAPDLPPAMQTWWEKAVHRDRELRFQSAKEMSDALADALGLEAKVMVPSIHPRRSLSSVDDEDPRSPISIYPSIIIDHAELPETQVAEPPLDIMAKRGRGSPAAHVALLSTMPPKRMWLGALARRHTLGLALGSAVLAGIVVAMTLYAVSESRARLASTLNTPRSVDSHELVTIADGPAAKPSVRSQKNGALAVEPEVVPVESIPAESLPTEPAPRIRAAPQPQPRPRASVPSESPVSGVPDYGI
jgi:serine/threonine protein kinase